MLKLNDADERRFWRDVYVACLITDVEAISPETMADAAVEEYRKRADRGELPQDSEETADE